MTTIVELRRAIEILLFSGSRYEDIRIVTNTFDFPLTVASFQGIPIWQEDTIPKSKFTFVFDITKVNKIFVEQE
jgi:hypothetical protein